MEEKKKYPNTRIPTEGPNAKGFSKRFQTYNGIEYKNTNIGIFHNMFMEACAEAWKFDLEREMARVNDKLTDSVERKIALEFAPLKKEIIALYNTVRYLRRNIEVDYERNKKYRAEMDQECRASFIFWVAHFGWSDNPRLVEFGMPSKVAFVLTQAQEKAVRSIQKCMSSRQNYLVEKSRDEGITELMCMLDVWLWLYTPGFKGGWGSRVEKLVDKRGDPNTIFSRLRRIIYSLPPKMRPSGYDNERNNYDKILLLENPDIKSFLIGEGGDNIGRGGRTSKTTVDEKAFVERPDYIDAGLSQNTNCQGDISTPNGQDEFYKKRMSGKVTVITLWWYNNPSKNTNWRVGKRPPPGKCYWYEYQVLTRDSALVAKEIDIDYLASIGGSMIEPEWVKSATDLALDDKGPRIGGLDISAGGKDFTIYIDRRGPVCSKPQPIPFSSPSKAAWAASEIGEEEGITTLVYDQNTLGEDMYTILKEGDRKVKFDLIGVHGQARASDRLYDAEGKKGYEKFRNLRAEIWWSLRKRFEKTHLHVTGQRVYDHSELISVPSSDMELLNQLSSPLLIYCPNGKIGVESKPEMRRRNVSSPDKADALSYCYFPMENTNNVIPHFKNTNSNNYAQFQLDRRMPIDVYVSIYHTESMEVYMIVTALNLNTNKLMVIGEFMYQIFDPEEMYRNAIDASLGFDIEKWYGNKEIFDGLTQGKNVLRNQYRKAKILITINYKDDMKVSITTLDKMFRDDFLLVHEDCENVMNHIRNWINVNGKAQNNLYYAMCLAQVITGLRRRNIVYSNNISPKIGYNIVS